MAIREIVLFGDERLRERAVEIDVKNEGWQGDAKDLVDTLIHLKDRFGFGNALAAPQIGSSYRMIAFNGSMGTFPAINPIISWRSEEMFPLWDDCFSLPSASAAVMRHREISFECIDETGQPIRFPRLSGDQAQLVQHEVDHLDGILMVDRLVSPGAIIAREMMGHAVHPSLRQAAA